MHLSRFLQLAGGIALVLAEPIPRYQHAPIKQRCLNETSLSSAPIVTGTGTVGPLSYFSTVTPLYPNSTGDPFTTSTILATGSSFIIIPTGTGTVGPLSYFSTVTPLYPNSTGPFTTSTILATGISFIIIPTGTGTGGPLSYSTSSALYPNVTTSLILTTGTGTTPTTTSAPYPIPSNSTAGPTDPGTTSIKPSGSVSIISLTPTGSIGTVSLIPTGSVSTTSLIPTGSVGTISLIPTGSIGTISSIPSVTTFTSTIASSSFTTVTKSVPNEYYYHHKHKAHDPYDSGYGPFRRGPSSGDDDWD